MKSNNQNPIKFAVVQLGVCVFGAGETRDAAIDATILRLDEMISHHENGTAKFKMLESDHADFDGYLKNQGGYEKIGNDWFKA